MNNKAVLRQHEPLPVIRDSNMDFWIHLDLDTDVCHIAPRM